MMTLTRFSAIAACVLLGITACTTLENKSTPVTPLSGTTWHLVSFQSSDDAIGEMKVQDPSQFLVTFQTDGTANLKVDCNRGLSHWTASAVGPDSGTLSLGPIALTRMMCPAGPINDRIVRDAEYIRSYRLVDGKLFMNLMADGGSYVWEPTAP
jgi:heat shock protein HslJ